MVKAYDVIRGYPVRSPAATQQLSEPSERLRSGHGSRVGAKLTVKAQFVIKENTISVGHCIIPLSEGLVPHCSVVWMGL